MSKRIKQIDNENIKIEIWKEPDVVIFDTDLTLNDTYCLFEEVINPFEMYQENLKLKKQVEVEKKSKSDKELLKRFEECIKLLNELDFDKYAYAKCSLQKIKNDLLNILILGYKKNE